jgi:electron transfer flavoprotein alpha subunit
MADHDAFLASSTTTGKNVAPRVAALLDMMQISDILSVDELVERLKGLGVAK